jgi:hypothetical protein
MGERIHGISIYTSFAFRLTMHSAYFLGLGLEEDRASELHHKYYTEYGLALRGLVRHHEIGEVALLFIMASLLIVRLPVILRPFRF